MPPLLGGITINDKHKRKLFLGGLELESMEQKIKEWLIFKYSSLEHFRLLRVLGKTWEKEMKQHSKMSVIDIAVALPPNFFESTVVLLENNQYEADNIGLTFEVIYNDPKDIESDEDGIVHKLGRCLCSIKGEYALLDSMMTMISITPIEFKYEELPEWVDKGGYFDISAWVGYWMRYDFTLPILITNWFGVPIKTAQQWIVEQRIPKSFEEKKKEYDYTYKHNLNIAVKLFTKGLNT